MWTQLDSLRYSRRPMTDPDDVARLGCYKRLTATNWVSHECPWCRLAQHEQGAETAVRWCWLHGPQMVTNAWGRAETVARYRAEREKGGRE